MLDVGYARRSIEEFHTAVKSCGGDWNRSDKIPLADYLHANGMERLSEHMRIALGPYWPIEIVDSMDRWLKIEYPNDAAKACGAFGVAVKVSDILRWIAEENAHHSAYHMQLADALDADPAPRPLVEDPKPRRERLLNEYLALTNAMAEDFFAWSDRTLFDTAYYARAALEGVLWGTERIPPSIPYPADFLPPGQKLTKDGYGGTVFAHGWVLHKAIEAAHYIPEGEREQMKLALQFYPDPRLDFEVPMGGSEPYGISSVTVSREHTADEIGPAIGSMHIDNYGTRSEFSIDPDQFEFRLHRSATPRSGDDDADLYFLVSDTVTYTARGSEDNRLADWKPCGRITGRIFHLTKQPMLFSDG